MARLTKAAVLDRLNAFAARYTAAKRELAALEAQKHDEIFPVVADRAEQYTEKSRVLVAGDFRFRITTATTTRLSAKAEKILTDKGLLAKSTSKVIDPEKVKALFTAGYLTKAEYSRVFSSEESPRLYVEAV